jgi:hypothetical protein
LASLQRTAVMPPAQQCRRRALHEYASVLAELSPSSSQWRFSYLRETSVSCRADRALKFKDDY